MVPGMESGWDVCKQLLYPCTSEAPSVFYGWIYTSHKNSSRDKRKNLDSGLESWSILITHYLHLGLAGDAVHMVWGMKHFGSKKGQNSPVHPTHRRSAPGPRVNPDLIPTCLWTLHNAITSWEIWSYWHFCWARLEWYSMAEKEFTLLAANSGSSPVTWYGLLSPPWVILSAVQGMSSSTTVWPQNKT